MNQVLFLCTGNFYRSRVAEVLFNHFSQCSLPNWEAISRGFGVDRSPTRRISSSAASFLESEGFHEGLHRFPIGVEPGDFLWSDRIVALNEIEHRPTLENRFQHWLNRIEFWNIPDIDQTSRSTALPKLEANVCELISVIKSESAINATAC